MKAETAAYLDKARRDLSDAEAIAAIGLAPVAARSAYYAAFHAAEAFIVERTGQVAKTHTGVRTMLAQLTRAEPAIDRSVLNFLGQGYVYKEISDYGVGNDVTITMGEARDAIAEAGRFIETIVAALGS